MSSAESRKYYDKNMRIMIIMAETLILYRFVSLPPSKIARSRDSQQICKQESIS